MRSRILMIRSACHAGSTKHLTDRPVHRPWASFVRCWPVGERKSTAGLFGLLAAGLGVCCGIPLLLSAGALGAVAGIGLGSWLVIVASVVAAAVGMWRWRQNAQSCDVPASAEVTDFEAGVDSRTL